MGAAGRSRSLRRGPLGRVCFKVLTLRDKGTLEEASTDDRYQESHFGHNMIEKPIRFQSRSA